MTESIVDLSKADNAKEWTSTSADETTSLPLDLERLTGFSDFLMEHRNDETFSWVFEQVVVIDNKEVDLLKAW
ncbi:unnamed protein product [Caretta caretta]